MCCCQGPQVLSYHSHSTLYSLTQDNWTHWIQDSLTHILGYNYLSTFVPSSHHCSASSKHPTYRLFWAYLISVFSFFFLYLFLFLVPCSRLSWLVCTLTSWHRILLYPYRIKILLQGRCCNLLQVFLAFIIFYFTCVSSVRTQNSCSAVQIEPHYLFERISHNTHKSYITDWNYISTQHKYDNSISSFPIFNSYYITVF